MRILFGGMVVADEPFGEGGSCTLLVPSGQQAVDVRERLRAAWASPKARGNRLHDITVDVTLSPEATLADAAMALLQYFASIPTEGALAVGKGGKVTVFAESVFSGFQAQERRGVTNGYRLTFVASQPTAVANYLQLTDGGALALTDESFLILEA